MLTDSKDILHQFDSLLGSSNQSWLLGAGISVEAKIPLMGPLTERVFEQAEAHNKNDHDILTAIKSKLAEDSHIEHILSELGDHRAIAERRQDQKVRFDKIELSLEDLDHLHQRLLGWIAETVRWGYDAYAKDDNDKVGSADKPIVNVQDHCRFVCGLVKERQRGVSERRNPVKLFTTNYDTLLEDALALECVPYWDGFSGGGVAFRDFHFGDAEPGQGYRAHVIKLHGSIDWHLGEDGRVWRVRDGDLYPERQSRVLIYPQSTKYVATQRDPFAAQFDLFRRSLMSRQENLFVTCGYSFGDEHINQEIEMAMAQPDNKTTVVAFSEKLNSVLEAWQKKDWNKRLYVITESGLFVGDEAAQVAPENGEKHDWWKFQKVAQILASGPEACLI